MSAYGLVDAVAARGTAAEAFAWITTAVFAGFSIGMALGGTLIEAFGPRASFVLGTAAAAVGAALVAAGRGLKGG
jgi:MFS family permease